MHRKPGESDKVAEVGSRGWFDRYVAAWLSARVGEVFATRITGVQKFGFFATIVSLGGDGLVPVSSLGDRKSTRLNSSHH